MPYKVNVGINYRVETQHGSREERVEPGDLVDLPPQTAQWALDNGYVEEVKKAPPRKKV